MSAKILDGKFVRDQLLAEARLRAAKLPRRPGIAVVLVGHDPASEVYVRNKVKACEEAGIRVLPPPGRTSVYRVIYPV